jgi:hypothetical protein
MTPCVDSEDQACGSGDYLSLYSLPLCVSFSSFLAIDLSDSFPFSHSLEQQEEVVEPIEEHDPEPEVEHSNGDAESGDGDEPVAETPIPVVEDKTCAPSLLHFSRIDTDLTFSSSLALSPKPLQ